MRWFGHGLSVLVFTNHAKLELSVAIVYRVGQKSKLLILSKYVDKTEKIGGV